MLALMLKTGRKAEEDKIRKYFSDVFSAEESGEEFPVNLEYVWPIGYGAKEAAVKALKKKFHEGIDYQALVQTYDLPGLAAGMTRRVEYHLTVSCMEYFAVRSNREVFDVYRQCRQAIGKIVRGALPDFSNPAIAARAWADEFEAKNKAIAEKVNIEQKLIEAKPKVDFYDAVAMIADTQDMKTVSNSLGWGRTRFMKQLRDDEILTKRNLPYQQYLEMGWFAVHNNPILRDNHPGFIAAQTTITGRGFIALTERYKGKMPPTVKKRVYVD